ARLRQLVPADGGDGAVGDGELALWDGTGGDDRYPLLRDARARRRHEPERPAAEGRHQRALSDRHVPPLGAVGLVRLAAFERGGQSRSLAPRVTRPARPVAILFAQVTESGSRRSGEVIRCANDATRGASRLLSPQSVQSRADVV